MLRIGLIGAGANTRARHIPGFRALPEVEIVAVCNRRPDSTRQVAREFHIDRTFDNWQELVQCADVDAVVIGTWPYLHAPITLAALEAGKHVLTEARMAMNAAEARAMVEAARRKPNLVVQIVPSPYGLEGDALIRQRISQGYLGQLREVSVVHRTAALADPTAPLHWRQDAALSGFNMLTLGIFHETLTRWVPQPTRVLAQVQAFIPTRIDPYSGVRRSVGTPDSVQVLTELPAGARAIYQFSGVTPYGQEASITLFGDAGVLRYDLLTGRIFGCSRTQAGQPGSLGELSEIPIPEELRGGWRCEAEFVEAIRTGSPIRFTSFADGLAYMEFTEAVARSAELGTAIPLPLNG